jgi:hypothetical protein
VVNAIWTGIGSWAGAVGLLAAAAAAGLVAVAAFRLVLRHGLGR